MHIEFNDVRKLEFLL